MPLSFLRRIWSIPVNLCLRARFHLTWCILVLNAVQQRIHLFIAERFRWYGFFAARHPYSLILLSSLVFLIMSYPLTEIPLTQYPPIEFVESSYTMKLPTPTWFYGESASVAILLPISVSLTLQPRITARVRGAAADSGSSCSPIRTTALAADRLIAALRSASSLPIPYDEACYRLSSGEETTNSKNNNSNSVEGAKDERPPFLPIMGECFITAPLTSLESYKQLIHLFDEKTTTASLPSNVTMSEMGLDLMFGVPFSATGLQSLYSASSNGKHARHLCASAVGHTVHFVAFAFFAAGNNISSSLTPSKFVALQDELLHSLSESEAADELLFASVNEDASAHRPAYLYFRSWNWLEFFPILAIYLVLLGYIYFSLTKIAMVKSKAGLAFGAVFGIAASFLVALGICTRLGLAGDYFFTVTDVFPYVVVLNGLENIVIITTAVTNCRREFKCDVPHCIAMGLELEGFRMVKHVFLAAFVSIIGVLTGVPQIRDFFLMALIGLCTDLLFQLVFFIAVLAVDIKRIELEEQCRGQLQHHRRQRSTGDVMASTGAVSSSSLSLFTWPWSIIPTSTPFGGSVVDNGRALGLSSSLAWLHSRRVSSLLSVFAILFITMLYLESYKSGFYYQLIVTPIADSIAWLVKPVISRSIAPNSSTIEIPQFSMASPSPEVSLASEWWRKLPRGHFQKLFGAAYDLPLTHRYLTILPPIELHAHVPLELVESAVKKDDKDLVSTPVFPSTPPSTPVTLSLANDEPISSHVVVIILVILSLSVIVNLSLLIYTCLKRRFRPQNTRQQLLNNRTALDFVTAHKQPTHVLRVTPVVTLNSFITAISSRLVVSTGQEDAAGTRNSGLLQRVPEKYYANGVAAHTADGLLTVVDHDLGEIQCQVMRSSIPHQINTNNGKDQQQQQPTSSSSSSSTSCHPCWALGAARDILYVSGAGSTVELYALVRTLSADAKAPPTTTTTRRPFSLSFQGVYSSAVSTASLQSIINLPGDALFALTFADGCVDIVYHHYSSANNNGNNGSSSNKTLHFTNIYTLRMRPPIYTAASNNLLAIGSADGCVRVLYISQQQASVANCATVYMPPNDSSSGAKSDEISAIAIDSTEPIMLAVGTLTGRLLLYELTPKADASSQSASSPLHVVVAAAPSSSDSTLATANLVFSATFPRSLPPSFSLSTSSATSNQIVSAISRFDIGANICIAVNAAGSFCVINRRRNPPIIVGTMHPNPIVSISTPMSPVLDITVIPSPLRADLLLSSPAGCGPNSSLFASAHSDGRILLWSVRDQFPAPAGTLFCVATAQSPVLSWPIEQLYLVEPQQASAAVSSQLIFSVRNKICRVDIPLNVNYTS